MASSAILLFAVVTGLMVVLAIGAAVVMFLVVRGQNKKNPPRDIEDM